MRGPHGSLRKTADGRGEEKPSTPSLSQGLPGPREARRSADSSPSAPPALLPLADPPLLLPQLPQISAFASRLWSPSSLRPPETSWPSLCLLLLPGHDRPSSQGEPAPSVPLTAREAPRAAASPSRGCRRADFPAPSKGHTRKNGGQSRRVLQEARSPPSWDVPRNRFISLLMFS